MSGSAQGSNDMKKAVVNDSKNGEQPLAPEKKPATQLEEDDEFEDFPVEGMLCVWSKRMDIMLTSLQTGLRRRHRSPTATHIFGKRAGMTMTQTTTLRSN
jgi:hypothetical protein